MRKLGLEFLGAFGLPPTDLARIAAELDCQFISVLPAPIDYNPEGHPAWSLRDDPQLRRELSRVLADTGIELTLGEGFPLLPDLDLREAYAGDLDLFRELGARRVNALSFDPSLERTTDQFARFVALAAERGLEPVLEFCPITVVPDFATALSVVRQAGGPARVLVDTMHTFRSGSTPEQLAAAEPELIGHIQLCDVPRQPAIADYLEEAMYERMVPGAGEAPLAAILAALPQVESIGLEIPLRGLAEQGIGVRERMRRCVEGARAVLAQVA
ncbi:MAG TPA: TIM barrel protein [Novosphingobium sp.]